MSLKSFIKKSVFGVDFPQEYLCIGKEDMAHSLRVLVSGSSQSFDISDQHLFLGYKPVIIGIIAISNSALHQLLSSAKSLRLLFRSEESANNPVAFLELQFFQIKDFGEEELFIFTAKKGHHIFLSPFHQLMNRMKDSLTKKRENNISLYGNLYDQVRIAYSFPRVISIISLGDGKNFNFFPTDLNGSISDQYYVISLRHEGKANAQVETCRKVCISKVSSSFFREAYAMGKNHMTELKPLESFEISSERSEQLNLPLPLQVLSYKELEHLSSVDIGIHRLHFFRIVHQKTLQSQPTLAHLHRYFAAWEKRKGGNTRYLIR